MNAFEAVALLVPGSSNAVLLHAFTWGLKNMIHTEVQFKNPTSLSKAEKVSLDVDEAM